MADHCVFCDTRRPEGGTNIVVVNGGSVWLEFCGPCGDRETLHNPDTGETVTVRQLFDRVSTGQEIDPEHGVKTNVGV